MPSHKPYHEVFKTLMLSLEQGEEEFRKECDVAKDTVRKLLGTYSRGKISVSTTTFRHVFQTLESRKVLERLLSSELECTHFFHLIDPAEQEPYREAQRKLEKQGELEQLSGRKAAPFTSGDTSVRPLRTVSLAELGAFLHHYSNLIKLKTGVIAESYMKSTGKANEWPGSFDSTEAFEDFLKNDFYTSSIRERRVFKDLTRLLAAFKSNGGENDVPRLMAEWLCAAADPGLHVALRFAETDEPRAYGDGVMYKSAQQRLSGMECAFIEFELSGNNPPPKMLDGKEDLCRVTKLIRELGNNPNIDDVPQSPLHVHPGDELIYVTSGCMYLQLENTGIWTCLQEGDFLHFTAEIPHAVWNVYPEPAKAIIIRFFQLKRHGTRDRQVEILEGLRTVMKRHEKPLEVSDTNWISALKTLGTVLPNWVRDARQCFSLWSEIAPWVHDRTRRPQYPLAMVKEGTPVQDYVGLSRFLLMYVADMEDDTIRKLRLSDHFSLRAFRDSIRKLEARQYGLLAIDRAHEGYDEIFDFEAKKAAFLAANIVDEVERTRVRSCFEGLPVAYGKQDSFPTLTTLGTIAETLDMPRVLLDGYLAPNALRVVAVHGATTSVGLKPLDWVPAPKESSGNADRVSYMLPARSLANSDISVVLLHLEPGGSTAWNHHPGFEAIIPIVGRCQVHFDESGRGFVTSYSSPCSDKGDGDAKMVVYRSSVSHKVIHAGSDTVSRMLVIRFNIRSHRV
jgi:quercetin dioxygenase-like cupin family protein